MTDHALRAEAAGLTLDAAVIESLARFALAVGDTNRTMNLTAPVSPEELWDRHILDSLLPLAAGMPGLEPGRQTLRACDVGCGAGFPGMPLLIADPRLDLTFLDSTAKKLSFIARFLESEGLSHGRTLNGRAEELGAPGGGMREAFDLTLSRAVAPLPALCELCLPLTAVGGLFLAYKGSAAERELADARRAVTLLGGSTEAVVPYKMPGSGFPASLIYIRKTRPTPAAYPRAWGKISKSAL